MIRRVFSAGFRPFFLGAALWAALAMALWIAMLAGVAAVPTALDPASWHAHEFLFGYLGAVLAGFLMTAVPNWTGRAPISGWPLALLFGLWLAGRVALAFSGYLLLLVVAGMDLAFLVALAVVMSREIVAGGNWRNLIVVVLLGLFTLANARFYWEAGRGDYTAQGLGLRAGLGVALMMIALIGGRIVPAFTRNWLTRTAPGALLPPAPMQVFDRLALLVLALALGLWVGWPAAPVTGIALFISAGFHAARLARWRGVAVRAEPLLGVLHVAYGFLPLGALAQSVSIWTPELISPASAQHLWMAGAIGLMTVGVMSRASLGHTGHALKAGPGTVALYVALIGAVAARFMAGLMPGAAEALYWTSGALWIAGFMGFAGLYGPLLLGPRAEG